MQHLSDTTERVEMLEAALNLLDESVIILDEHATILFWNEAATAVTGYSAQEVALHRSPQNLYRIDQAHQCAADGSPQPCLLHDQEQRFKSPTLVSMAHKLGHSIPCMLRKAALHPLLGELGATALLFYPVEEANALPHGECAHEANVERSQADMEDRLDAAHHQWATNRAPYGLMWLIVDQAESLRRTHGKDACEAMLQTVEHTLIRQMKPVEVLGRWGSNEFLLLTHERSSELVAESARRLAGLARTADFRWWGDRVALTVSIGVSQSFEGCTLQSLLQSAQHAMQASSYAGGNHVTESRGE